MVNKIKSVLALYNKTFADWARALKIYPQSLNKLAKKKSFKLRDMIVLAEMIDCKISITKDDKILMTFDKADIEELQ